MKRSSFVTSTLVFVLCLSGCTVATDETGDIDPSEGPIAKIEQPIGGLILAKYLALNAQNGPLGAVLQPDDEKTTLFNTGRYNLFANGRILWKFGASEAFSSYGWIDHAYTSFGLEWGSLGFPTLDETDCRAVASGPSTSLVTCTGRPRRERGRWCSPILGGSSQFKDGHGSHRHRFLRIQPAAPA